MTAVNRTGWGSRDFVKLWSAATVSYFGTSVTRVALPLVALVALDANTFQVGVIYASGMLAWLLLSLSTGVWLDRRRRRPVMIVCDLARALALLSVPVAYALDVLTIVQLILVAFVVSVASVFFDIAGQAYVPSILSEDELLRGNGRLQAGEAVADTGGTAVGGVVVQAVGAPAAILADVATYLVSAVCLVRIRRPEPAPASPEASPRMLPQIREGLAFVVGEPLLRSLTLVASGLNFFTAAFEVLTIPFLLRNLDASPATIGVLLGVAGAGSLTGAALSASVASRVGAVRTLYLVAFIGPPFAFLLPLSFGTSGLVLCAVGLFGREVCIAVFSLLSRTYRQQLAPRHLLARVTASVKFASWGVIPIGGLLGGLLGAAMGNRAALLVVCVGLLLTPLPLVLPVSARRSLVATDGRFASASSSDVATPPEPEPEPADSDPNREVGMP